ALSGKGESIRWLDGVITFAGRQDNLAVRQAALIALAFNLLMVIAAVVFINEGQRRIPIQAASRVRGRRMYQG
ncbi:hypothetical protein GPV71_24885, partial [Salmonella enterica subsp. enterica serovar Typhimurium]|nr:hypothetical protein [Salmonella enterica subsp. enterica serovar Typhimurium]